MMDRDAYPWCCPGFYRVCLSDAVPPPIHNIFQSFSEELTGDRDVF